jgi:hypothetical protein
MNGKLVPCISIVILIVISACGANPVSEVPTLPDLPKPTLINPAQISPTLQVSNLDFWDATADFGRFTFLFNTQTQMGVVGRFDFVDGFSCGTSEGSGSSYEVFNINVLFPLPKPVSKRDPPATVTFPIDDTGFIAGPFWIATKVPVTEERIPILTMTLIGTFDSDTKVSGEYTAYFVSNPGSMELQSIPCTRPFTATLISP